MSCCSVSVVWSMLTKYVTFYLSEGVMVTDKCIVRLAARQQMKN